MKPVELVSAPPMLLLGVSQWWGDQVRAACGNIIGPGKSGFSPNVYERFERTVLVELKKVERIPAVMTWDRVEFDIACKAAELPAYKFARYLPSVLTSTVGQQHLRFRRDDTVSYSYPYRNVWVNSGFLIHPDDIRVFTNHAERNPTRFWTVSDRPELFYRKTYE